MKSSSDREKDHVFERGMSFMERAKIVSGRGLGEVMMARWRAWSVAGTRWELLAFSCSSQDLRGKLTRRTLSGDAEIM